VDHHRGPSKKMNSGKEKKEKKRKEYIERIKKL